MIYLYAIGDGATAVHEAGLDDRPVETVRHGRLMALVSRGLQTAVEARPGMLRCHERVVTSAMEAGPVLPMRFGTLVGGDHELHAVLSERGVELERALDRVRGRVELGVSALWPRAVAEPVAETGRAFLVAKLERRDAARRIARELHSRLVELAIDARCTLLPREDTPFAGAYLVDRGRVDGFERVAEALGLAQDEVELVLTGPWAPYSFCENHDD